MSAPGKTARILSDAQVAEIRAALKLRRENHPKLIAAKYGVSRATIYLVERGREYSTKFVPRESNNPGDQP